MVLRIYVELPFYTDKDRKEVLAMAKIKYPQIPPCSQTPVAVLIANEYLDKLNFVEYINSQVVWDRKKWNVSPGILAKAVILSTFYEVRSPLYRIIDKFTHSDNEFLFGSGITADDLKDDAIASCLDRIYDACTDKLFSTISLSAYTNFNLNMSYLHSDTSNLVLYGEYEMCEEANYEGLDITYGHSKANRPDKKQVSVGTIVNQQGIPLISKTLAGNVADCQWNQEAIGLLKEVLGEKLTSSIYVADCKLITMPNIHLLCDETNPVQFISRCPDSFYGKISDKMVVQAYVDNNWSEPISIGKKDSYTRYRLKSYIKTVERKLLRFIVVETTSKEGLIGKTLDREKLSFEKSLKLLTNQTFACQKDAEKALQSFNAKNKRKLWLLNAIVCSETKVKLKRGRHPKGAPAEIDCTIINWYIQSDSIEQHKENVAKATQCSMTFVLVTNVLEEKMDDAKVIFAYKGQSVVEVQFHLLKKPCLASQVFLKKPQRIDALMMLLNISLLIRALMQYQARETVKTMDQPPKIGVGGRKFDIPTAENILALLRNYFIFFDGKNRYHSTCNEFRSERLGTLLHLLNVEEKNLFEMM